MARSTPSTGRRLVIVESPAKAKTIAGYLGKDYMVESSVGHIRDLPHSAAEVPAAQKQESWARLGVDVEHDFDPLYVVDPKKKNIVSDLRDKLKGADELLLATDEDREGEAIAWHLVQVLKPTVPVRRMVFHEITKQAIERALGETRDIDDRLVDAQETRRILDRLYGYEVSPVLWRKVMKGLSAGRVQSVATRLVVERERERIAFRAVEYWDIVASLDPGSFEARLVALDERKVAQGRDFARSGELITPDAVVLDAAGAEALAAGLEGAASRSGRSSARPYTRRPAAPFMTSTLQQEASRKLRFAAAHTMRVAQRLYDNGFITYMRTDSTSLSETAITAARARHASSTAPTPSRRNRASTTARSRTRRKPTRRSARPATGSGRRTRLRANSSATRQRSTSSSGSGRSPLRWPTRAVKPSRSVSGQRPPTAETPSLRRRGRSSRSGASCSPTKRGVTKRPPPTRANEAFRRSPRARCSRHATCSRSRTRPSPRRATPRQRSCAHWRSGESVDPRPTPRSSARFSTAATFARSARRSCRRSWPSRSPICSSSTSGDWSTTSSPP